MIDRRNLLAGSVFAIASCGDVARAAFAGAPRSFAADFRWGAATAAYQVEGNNVNSDVWPLEHVTPTAYPELSGDAANSFELWPVDLDLVKDLGLNTYRFSLEWGRIEPAPGQFSVAMLDHYQAMIAGCHARGLMPVVTFCHFTTPVWFAARGGWMADDAPALFARYCARAARHLADGIGYATTLNEPNLTGMLAMLLPHDSGDRLMAIDRQMSAAAAKVTGAALYLSGNALWIPDPAKVQAHLLAGHHEGRAAIKSVRRDLPVGVSLAMNDDQASGPGSRRDEIRARLYDPWLDAAKDDDFIGVQNYWRAVWNTTSRLPAPKGANLDFSGQEIYPPSLGNAVRYAWSRCRRPVLVTENGVNTRDDRQRAAYIPEALAGLHQAMAEGIPVLGYTHWSLIDNWEWFFGYGPQYGLHTLDRETFRRTPKPSAGVLGSIARRGAL